MNMSVSSQLPSAARKTSSGFGFGALHEYFRYHGALAPGIKLLRTLSFPVKAVLVATAFLMPVVLICTEYMLTTAVNLRDTRNSLAGVAAAREIVTLADAVQADRRNIFLALTASNAARDPNLRSRIAEAYEAVQNRYNDVGEVFGVTQAFHEVRQRHAAIADAGGPSHVGQLKSRLDYLNALQNLQAAVVRGSGMQRGTEPEVHDTQDLVLQIIPKLVTHTASLGAYGAMMLSGEQDPGLRVSAQGEFAIVSEAMNELNQVLQSLERADPDMAARLRKPEAWKPITALLAEAQKSVLVPTPTGVPAAFLTSAELAIKSATAVQRDGTDALADMLKLRQETIEGHRHALLLFVAVCIGFAVYILLSFYKVMDGGLRQIQGQVKRMADGDLSLRPAPLGKDEVAVALSGLGQSVGRLAELFATVRQGVGAVSFASQEIARGNVDLTRRTELSANGVQQVVNGVTRYIDQLDQSGQRVDDAVQVVDAMRLDAARSRTHMQKLQERMRALQGKSREIGEIVELIDGIAFRTNILALNASVEAAKAGDAGRGFAVVAQEVRSLAMRSAESARQINDIISRSTEDIQQGSELAERAGETLRETDNHVMRIHQTMTDIVALTRSGQSNSQSILKEIRDLGQITGENTHLVEQMAAASGALSQHGEALDQKVATFKLG